ncbi:MAG: FAD-binding domain-containing protein [Candidatus Pacearchaeota archaeon]
MGKIILFHRKDLRTHDNKALNQAHKHGQVIPVYVISQETGSLESWRPKYCPDKNNFLVESLKDLNGQYVSKGSSLNIIMGDVLEKLKELSKKLNASVYFNRDPRGHPSDEELLKSGFFGFDCDGIQRSGRKNWHKNCKKFFYSEEYEEPSKIKSTYDYSEINIDDIPRFLNCNKEKEEVPKGGTEQALKLLESFKLGLKDYNKSIEYLPWSESGTSRLSAHFSLGTLSLRRAFQEIDKLDFKQKESFKKRLFFNQHFIQKLQDNPKLIHEAANPIFENSYDTLYSENSVLIDAWKNGKTGYPLIDASVRALVKIGFINFRMRATLATFFTYILKQPWNIGADFMHYHLIDSDVGINYSQWQMHCGLVGVHPNNIHNPTTHINENDPNCEFILKYVPELRDFDIEDIKKNPKKRTQTEIKSYMARVIDYEIERDKAIKIYKKLNKDSRDYLRNNPDIYKKLSLSTTASKRDFPVTKEV